MVKKSRIICNDNYVVVEGLWIPTGSRLMWIAVYAPQNNSSKITLWSSLTNHIANWNGSSVIMGDFNEVRVAEERSGSVFIRRHSDIFNAFISNSYLIDIQLGGYNFTWTNKLGTKMSKLDRFLTSKSFHEDFPHVTGIVLVNGDPDHRPILLKEFKILGDINRLEANDIAQKANIKWAIEGDENTSFFPEPFNIKAEFLDHFSKRFQRSHGITPSLDGDMPNCLSPTQSEFLERQISREEIKKAVWDCGGERAPGPDGFTFKFVTTFWDLIEDDVIRFVQEFYHSSYFPKGCNSFFIDLIPKISNAKFVLDFRPISLIGCQYKIIGKILANRLSKVIESIISPEQSAFIKGRNILDGPLILNEVLAWTRKHKQNLMVFKVEFEKAFDSLRQGDLLSPFLFILAMEGLHVLTCKAKMMGLFKGASISHGNDIMSISHLMYADDVIFLGIAVSQEKVSDMANTIGCDVATFPLKYLGVPVGCNMARCSYWNDILLKFTSKLSLWKARMKLESMRNTFFIDGDLDKKKMTWVKWKNCLASKELGGLGIGNIYGLNLGLLFKWIWRFLSNSPNLWVRVVKTLHGTNGGITKDVKKIGNRASYRFWEDIWCGNQPLKVQFPRIFQLELEKNCFIADRIGSADWHDVFRRPPRRGAGLSQLNDLLSLTQDVVLSNSSDSWIWSVDVPSGYSVASARTLIDSSTLDVDPKATRWNRFIPNKVNEIDIPVCANAMEWFEWLDGLAITTKVRSYIEGVGGVLLWHIWKVISAIHGTDGKIGTRTKSGYNSLWRDIVFEMEAVKDKGADLFSIMQNSLGDGVDTFFWKDTWNGEPPFKLTYPRLYALEVDKNISVADKLAQATLAGTFRREPRSGIEAVQLAKLEDQLEDVQLVNKRDIWAWSLNGSGEFSVASIKRLLDDIRLSEVSSQTRWIKAVPIKVNILAWKVRLNGLPSRVNISRRGIDINSILCPICEREVESVSHVFFSCYVAKDNFKKVCRWWNVDFAEVSSYDEWLLWISSLMIHGGFTTTTPFSLRA
nr:RNA-directed DNA polymerase, eukaryota [Tanacetum cinerariifolium]